MLNKVNHYGSSDNDLYFEISPGITGHLYWKDGRLRIDTNKTNRMTVYMEEPDFILVLVPEPGIVDILTRKGDTWTKRGSTLRFNYLMKE